MGQGQDNDPYGDAGGFTPYQPDATPDSEPPAEGAPPPFVPYGGTEPAVPYGGSAAVSAIYTTSTAKSGVGCVPWVIGIGVLIATCGGGIAAIVGVIGGFDSEQSAESIDVLANDLQEGQCVNGAGLEPGDSNPVTGLEVVECTTAHDGEVLAVKVLDEDEAAAYDFDDSGQIDANCRSLFSDREKEILRAGDYFIWALTETTEPAAGDKVACILVDAQGDTLHGPVDMASPEPPA